jgi:hypothetical protein
MNARNKEAQDLEQNAFANKLSITKRVTTVAVTVRRALKAWSADLLIINVDSADLYTEVLHSHVY